MTKLIIMDELMGLLDRLDAKERDQLEANIVEEGGIREPIIVWEEKGAIIDGFNRNEICNKYGFETPTNEKSFSDIDEVKEWMLRNQLGRRNVTPERKKYYIGELALLEDRKAGRPAKDEKPKQTVSDIAKSFGVSEKTVQRSKNYAKGVDAIADVKGDDAKEETLSGKGMTSDDVERVGKAASQGSKKAASTIKALEKFKKSNEKKKAAPDPADTLYKVVAVEPDFFDPNCPLMSMPPVRANAMVYLFVPDGHLEAGLKLLKDWRMDYQCTFVIRDDEYHDEGVWSEIRHSFLLVGSNSNTVESAANSKLPSIPNGAKKAPVERIRDIITHYHNKETPLCRFSTFKAPQGWATMKKDKKL